jgi:hypothetical protein
MRLHFIHSNHLAGDFSFATYLRKCKRHVFIQLTRVNGSAWLLLVSIICIDLFQRDIFFSRSFVYYDVVSNLLIFMSIAGILLSIVPIIIHYKIKHIFLKIHETKLIEFDPILARYYFQHQTVDEDGTFDHVRKVSFTDSQNRKIELDVEKVSKQYTVDNWGDSNQMKYTNAQQLSLFWFGSHNFIIYLIQSILFLFVFYIAILLQFTSYFINFSSWIHSIGTIVRLVPIPVILFVFPRSIPLYTVIINIGQMVDLRIVAEAFQKARKYKFKRKSQAGLPADVARLSGLELQELKSDERGNDKAAEHVMSPDTEFEASMTRKMTVEDSIGSYREDSINMSEREDSMMSSPRDRTNKKREYTLSSFNRDDLIRILDILSKVLFPVCQWLLMLSLLIYAVLNVQSMKYIWIVLRWLNFAIALLFVMEYFLRCVLHIMKDNKEELYRFWHVFDGIAILLQFIMVIILLIIPDNVFLLLSTILRLVSILQVEKAVMIQTPVIASLTKIAPTAGGAVVVD